MSVRVLSLSLIILAIASPIGMAQAQFLEKPVSQLQSYTRFEFTAAANPQPERQFAPRPEAPSEVPAEKSGFLAGILSLAVPGLGELYVGDQLWRAPLFLVAEAGLWYGVLRWNARGNDSTDAFHDFAHQHWSPDRYADHLNNLLVHYGVRPIVAQNATFEDLRAAEDTLNSLGVVNFTHRIPDFGSQQYYELISKYIQYTRGWDDAVDDVPEHSPNYQTHAVMRDNMNYQFAVSEYFGWGVILNHVLSAVDAALLAKSHNSNMRISGGLEPYILPGAETKFQPTARITVGF